MSKLVAEWQGPATLAALFEQLPEPYVVYDDRLTITGLNVAAERMLRRSAEETIGRRCRDVFRCASCEPDCGMCLGLKQASIVNSSAVHIFEQDGQERIAVLRTVPVRTPGGRTGVIARIDDISDATAARTQEVVAESQAMRDIMTFVRRVAASEASAILIEGESGTGKDLIAKTLHHLSLRRAEPFLTVNCAAISETLLETELFGYEKGACTDARTQKRGIFELADQGTLFLDEIAEMPLVLQAKLLHVLEEQSFRRVGGLDDIHVSLRVIASTNKNLREAVREGAFRQDLYFRLNVIQIAIPPLRERPDDIMPLTHFYMKYYNRKFKRHIEHVSPEVEPALIAYGWPGNVRELRNAIERAMILEESSTLTLASLPAATVRAEKKSPAALTLAQVLEAGISLEENERMLLKSALEKTGGNQTQAAHVLGITRDTLRYRMKKFNLN
ncbi:MAG TPA: sigma 54-interacting transcriptional regulator [Bryobacteraceae bacterium]|nr:sigma 54-interacting transcriptional regulator [Bryobacteraceae bacterium]